MNSLIPIYRLFEDAYEKIGIKAFTDGITYKNKNIKSYYPINKSCILRFSFISSNSFFEQAIVVSLDDDFQGSIYLNGKNMKIPNSRFPKFVFWKETAPVQFEIAVTIENGFLAICNGSDPFGDKKICRHLSGGCAFFIEKLEDNKLRFHCNDHENDDDFDDLIFDLEFVLQE